MSATSNTYNVVKATRSVDDAEKAVSSLSDAVEHMISTNRTMPTSKSEQAINLYDAAMRDAAADMERMEAERAAAQKLLEENLAEREGSVRSDIDFHEQGLKSAREELKQLGIEFKLQSKELVERYDSQIKAAIRMKEANKAARDILLGDL